MEKSRLCRYLAISERKLLIQAVYTPFAARFRHSLDFTSSLHASHDTIPYVWPPTSSRTAQLASAS
jgi:hypothetical protein